VPLWLSPGYVSRRFLDVVRNPRVRVSLGIVVVSLAIAIALWAVFVGIPNAAVSQDDARTGAERIRLLNDVRTVSAQLLAGVLVLGGLLLTARSIAVNREGHFTERFTQAIDQLGNDKLEVRLGGIYALERVARFSRPDRGQVLETLSAFVRLARVTSQQPQLPGKREDIRAALRVLGRRRPAPRQEDDVLDLTRADLRGADLVGVELKDALLHSVRLEGAELTAATLRKSSLIDADFSRADLVAADLRDGFLIRGRFVKADLSEADLRGVVAMEADFRGVDLTAADLRRADMSDARFDDAAFSEVVGRRADFEGAQLPDSDFNDADLRRATFNRADLSGANFQDARGRSGPLPGSALTG
jgi:uncharacterized protein YjbI with pentapeptide repeats